LDEAASGRVYSKFSRAIEIRLGFRELLHMASYEEIYADTPTMIRNRQREERIRQFPSDAGKSHKYTFSCSHKNNSSKTNNYDGNL